MYRARHYIANRLRIVDVCLSRRIPAVDLAADSLASRVLPVEEFCLRDTRNSGQREQKDEVSVMLTCIVVGAGRSWGVGRGAGVLGGGELLLAHETLHAAGESEPASVHPAAPSTIFRLPKPSTPPN